MAEAAYTVDSTYRTPSHNSEAMEPHCAIASWEGDHATSGRARATAGLRQSTTSTVLAAQQLLSAASCAAAVVAPPAMR